MIGLYYRVFDALTSGWLARSVGGLYGLRRPRIEAFSAGTLAWNDGASPLWFHAASVGELEMLRPILDRALELGIACSVSAFSDSALGWLESLRAHPHSRLLRFVGLSPREREWSSLWDRHQVRQVWIAKYDLWPGMWDAAAARGIEVHVINARYRTSWSRLESWMARFGKSSPRLFFHCSHLSKASELRVRFPRATIDVGLDPRRFRIRTRAQILQPRAEQIKVRIAGLPRPVGIVGSAWPSDLELLVEATSEASLQGSLIVFPHSFDPSVIGKLEIGLAELEKLHGIRTLLIEEKGVLLECYAAADWVWVGGGFGSGIHSTLEPAFYGVPIGAGPRNAAKFDEIDELVEAKQLTLCSTAVEIARWLQSLDFPAETGASPVPFPDRADFEAWIDPWLAPLREQR